MVNLQGNLLAFATEVWYRIRMKLPSTRLLTFAILALGIYLWLLDGIFQVLRSLDGQE